MAAINAGSAGCASAGPIEFRAARRLTNLINRENRPNLSTRRAKRLALPMLVNVFKTAFETTHGAVGFTLYLVGCHARHCSHGPAVLHMLAERGRATKAATANAGPARARPSPKQTKPSARREPFAGRRSTPRAELARWLPGSARRPAVRTAPPAGLQGMLGWSIEVRNKGDTAIAGAAAAICEHSIVAPKI